MNSIIATESSEHFPGHVVSKKPNFKFTRKPLKILSKQITNASSMEPLKIIDLNLDCLEHILRGFNLTDLISIGSTCIHLNDAVCRTFTLMFKKHEVFIDCNQFPRFTVRSQSNQPHQRESNGNNIETFLKVFGTEVKKLTVLNMSPIKYEDIQRVENDKNIEQLITKYCKKYLTAIQFKNCGKCSMLNAQPFEKITKVIFEQCTLSEKFSDFSYLFPGMRLLEMIDCNVTNVQNSIEKEFPHLESLSLAVPFDLNSWARSTFSVENIMAVMDHNQNLKYLSLQYWNESAYDAKLLKYASVKLNELKTLQIWHSKYTDLGSHGNLDFKSVRKLILSNTYHVPGRLTRNLDIFTCENLQTFSIHNEFDAECTTFIDRHKTIKKIMILPKGRHDWYPLDADIQRITSKLGEMKD